MINLFDYDTFSDREIDVAIVNMVIGEFLGEGVHRKVFRSSLNSDWVIKIALSNSGIESNINEATVWHDLRGMDASNVLVPCVHLSACGMVLIQEFAEDITHNEMPKYVYEWMTDTHCANFGKHQGKVKLRDYGSVRTSEYGKRLKINHHDVLRTPEVT